MPDFTHPLERIYFGRLNQNKTFRVILAALSKTFTNVTTIARVPDRSLAVTKNTFPRLHTLYQIARERLGVDRECLLFCSMDYGRNAKTVGTDSDCVIVIDSACLEDFSDEQILALLGRELGHVKMQHINYLSAFEVIDGLATFIPSMLVDTVKGLLLDWLLAAEYTADRAGAIAAGDVRYVVQNHLMTCGIENIDDSADFELYRNVHLPQNLNGFDRAARVIMTKTLIAFPMPFAMPRIKALLDWSVSEECARDFPTLYRAAVAPETTALSVPDKVIEFSSATPAVDRRGSKNLIKGQKFDITKNNPALKNFWIGFSWNAPADFEMDDFAILLGEDGRIRDDSDFVFYNNPINPSHSVKCDGEHKISIDIDKIPSEVARIDFALAIYEAESCGKNFSRIGKAEIFLVDTATSRELARFDMSGIFSAETAIIAGEIYRYKGDWKFNAVGAGFNGGLEALCQRLGVELD